MRAAIGLVISGFVLGAVIPAARAGDLGIAVTISGEITPGVYGRVDLGNRAPPPVVYEQPVIIEPAPTAVRVEPIYLHVPPGHARNWSKHCHEYHACNRPVYFVRSAEYEPGYERNREDRHGHHKDDRDNHEHRGNGHHDD